MGNVWHTMPAAVQDITRLPGTRHMHDGDLAVKINEFTRGHEQ